MYHPDDVARRHDERQEALARASRLPTNHAPAHDGQYRWRLIQYNPLRATRTDPALVCDGHRH